MTQTLVAAALWQSAWALGAIGLAWVLAWAATLEPRIARNPRHRDVAAFQKTPAGRALMHRRGWIPSTPRWWIYLLFGLLLVGPGLAAGLWYASTNQWSLGGLRLLAALTLSSAPVVLSAGLVADVLLLQPLVMPFVALLFVLVLGINVYEMRLHTVLQMLAGLAGFAALLYAVDIARLLRRSRLESLG